MKALIIILSIVVSLYCCSVVLYACCRLADKLGVFDEETHVLLRKISGVALYFVCLPLAIYRKVKRDAN